MFKVQPRKITPIIKEVLVDGIAAHSASGGGKVDIIQKAFITSLDSTFESTANQFISLTLGYNCVDDINNLLVLIKHDNTAYIYTDYFFSLSIRSKRDIQSGNFVFESDIADIESVSFDMGDYSFDYQKGDKIIWLFRLNWKFGLYFDLTKDSSKENIYLEMGTAYKLLKYYDLYTFLEKDTNFDQLINDGWFPFIELIGQEYKQLIGYYSEKDKFEFKINKIMEHYDQERLYQLSGKWWRNKIYAGKKEIIEAGINSYILNTRDGFINCIKNLSTELEGIMRLRYIDINQKAPTTKEMKSFVISKAKEKFGINNSLSFPDLFQYYMDEVLFKGFDVVTGEIPASRHTFAHGVAKEYQYTKIKAFQIILSLDQLFYYL